MMKKLLLISLALIMTVAVSAQFRHAAVPKSLQDVRVPYKTAVNDYQGPVQNYNPVVSTRANVSEIIGNTFYDLQTNGAMAQRLYLTEDGKMGAAWTRGITSTSYPDRGTGYNYYDGTAWGPAPTNRIETMRTGFPSIAQWNGNGEAVVSHQSSGPLLLNTRPVAGTGAWTQTTMPIPSGAPMPLWPSMITSGPNHEIIHVLALTTPTASGGAVYNNLDGALLYWRSSDGGATWEQSGYQFPQMSSPEYIAFNGDSYTWANPKGDTIAFIYGEDWTDTFVMYSYDGGDTWNKTTILGNQYKATPAGTVIDPFYTCDGSTSLAIDNNGVFHASFGRMRAAETTDGRVWYPYTDGLIYWNSMMPQLQDSLDLDTLFNHGQLVGWVTGDTIIAIPYYYHSMTSYPGITVDDESGRIFIITSGVVTENPANDLNFRHIKAIGCNNFQENYTLPVWGDQVDLNSGIDDMYLEFIFPALAKNTTTDQIHYIVQSSDVPGSNILVTTVPVHDNNIIYNGIDKDLIVIVGMKEIDNVVASVSNYPNPFRGATTISIGMKQAGRAVLEVSSITGQVVATSDLGNLVAGNNHVTFDASSLSAGVYLYSVKVNGVSRTGRMIVK